MRIMARGIQGILAALLDVRLGTPHFTQMSTRRGSDADYGGGKSGALRLLCPPCTPPAVLVMGLLYLLRRSLTP